MTDNKYRKRPMVVKAIQLLEDNIDRVCEFLGEKADVDGYGAIPIDGDQFKLVNANSMQGSCNITTSEGACKITTHDGTYKIITADRTYKILVRGGLLIANLYDWIIKDENGRVYPCKPDIFEKTYEKE